MNRFLKYINYTIAILLLAGLGLVYWYAWRVLPQTSGTVQAAIGARATAVRDRLGIPHISAATAEDAWFVQGYVTAQDRLFQMEFTRRQAAGELAAIFGPVAVESDIEMRRLRMRRIAERNTRSLTPAENAAFAAYARGVNHFLETHRGRLPVEFTLLSLDPEPWTITDSILAGMQIFRTLTTSWRDEINKAAIAAGGDAAKTAYLFPLRTGSEPSPGSNAWAISGKRTRSGKPILASDPHLGFSLPGLWYQVEIMTPEFDVAGVSLPGMPAVIIGHNSRLAWASTNLGFDVQDLYRERVNAQAGVALYNRQVEAIRQEPEVIQVRGEQPRVMGVLSTRHGPVFLNEQNTEFALRWTAAEPGVFSYPFLDLARASDWAQFRAALSRFGGPPQNFVYADADGNIGYQVAGRLPIRRTWDGDVPADGSTGEQEWDGFIPFDDLPSTYNPPSGVIVTANQNPFPADYQYRVNGYFAPPDRARQIHALLEARPNGWQAADMLIIQKDVYSAFSHFLAGELLGAWKRRGNQNPALAGAGAVLADWNGQMEKGTPAPMLVTLAFQQIRKAVAERAAPGKGSIYETAMSSAVIERLLREKPRDWFPDYDLLLIRTLTDAIEQGAPLQGRDVSKWDYGRFSEMTLRPAVVDSVPMIGHYFRIGPAPMSGSTTTVKQTTLRVGPSMRMVTDLGDLGHVLNNVTTGASGQALSSHFRDQWNAYYSGTSFPMEFGRVEGGQSLEFVPAAPQH